MRFVARAPITTTEGRDIRPGDTFEMDGGQARAFVDAGLAEPIGAPDQAAAAPPAPAGKDTKRRGE